MTILYEDYNHFRRLHPLTLLYGLIRNLPYLLITFYLGIYQRQTEELIYIGIFLLVGMVIIPAAILRWYYFTFMISDKEIIIKSGILAKKQRTIPIERVQNLNVKQDLIQRILGIARLQIETAGDTSAEGVLEFVKLKDADEINRIIRTYQHNLSNTEFSEAEFKVPSKSSESFNATEHGNTLLKMTNRDVFVYGMIRLRPLFLVYGAWAMSYLSQFQFLQEKVFSYLDDTFTSFFELPIIYLIPLILVFVLFSVIISWLIDIIWTFVQFYGFKIVKDGNKLFASYGMLSRYSITIPLKKLQQITISTNPVKKKFDFFTMILHTAGYDITMKSSPAAVPLAKRSVLNQIAQQIYPVNLPETYKSISEKSIRRAFVLYFILSIPVFVSSLWIFEVYGLITLAILPLLYYFAILRWRHRGYEISDNLIFVRQGVWNQKVNVIPAEKIQTLHIVSTIFQRRLKLATIHIDTAASGGLNDATIPDIDLETAEMVLQDINIAFKKSNKVTTI